MLGLDLQGGLRVTLEAEPQGDAEITDEDLELARDIIERRVAGIGVSEPQVRTETAGDGSRRIVVEVPGVSDESQVRDLVGSTGQLQFIDPQGYTDPQGQPLQRDQEIRALLEDGSVRELFNGGQIQQGSVVPDTDGRGQIGVSFSLLPEGNDIWCEFTTANVGRPGPIALDGRIITTPEIGNPICEGSTIITVGPPNPENELERTSLYNTLRFGALPLVADRASASMTSTRRSAPDFLVQALVAGGVGLLLVLIFMIALLPAARRAGRPGARLLHARRVRDLPAHPRDPDPRRRGGLHPQHRHGGRREHPHLRAHEGGDPGRQDARPGDRGRLQPGLVEHPRLERVSSLLVAGWLYWQGTTVVRGFALVLIIGVLVSMFSAVTVTRTMLRYVTRTSWGRRLELYHVER